MKLVFGQDTSSINLFINFVSTPFSCTVDCFTFILSSPTSDGVKVFHSKAKRVHHVMAGGASFIVTVFFEFLAESKLFLTRFPFVKIRYIDICRSWWRLATQHEGGLR